MAASCNGASHTPKLSAGRVTPDMGPTGTVFRFVVTYRDTGNCMPNYVRVRVAGVGTFSMSGDGTDWDGGVRFVRNVAVTAAGRHGYEFVASSGTGNGTKTTALSDVSPQTFDVVAPTPTPQPSPKPTPKPTVVPATPKPTAQPTAKPAKTAEPTRRPRRSPEASGTRRATPTASATPAIVLPGPTDRPGGYRIPPRPRQEPAGFDLFRLRLDPVLLRVAQWSGITAAGLLLLFALTWRRREPQPITDAGDTPPESGGAAGRVAPGAAAVADAGAFPAPPASSPPPAPAASVRRDEANMPRWLRPSVQAGRQGRSLED